MDSLVYEDMKIGKAHNLDRSFLTITLILLGVGLMTFISSSLGVFTDDKAMFSAMMVRHVGFGVLGGLLSMTLVSRIHFSLWQRFSPYILVFGLILTLLVFVPGLGLVHGGAHRWISLGFISFQPAEMLKFAVIVFLSAWFAKHHKEIHTFRYGFLPFIIVLALAIGVLFKQPDTSTIALIGLVSFIIYWIKGASWKHVGVSLLLAAVFIVSYVALNPHVIDRIQSFQDASKDPYGSSYQIRQSKIAIGSGKLYGRGLGQSVHKFGPYLPESNSDSIFAVFAEEYGFIGSTILIILYILFALFGFRIAKHAPTEFSQNLVVGIILLIVIQVFFNIAAISGIIPLSGLPLIFMSNGGTALLVTLTEIGIILNISRYTKKRIAG